MTLLFYSQPYDISAERFYFRSIDEFSKQSADLKYQHGQPVEEFEIQFIDGDLIDFDLAKAWGVNQANISRYFEVAEEWDEHEKIRFILAVGECGCDFDPNKVSADGFDVDIYRLDSMRDLAIEFVEEGLFAEISERFQSYIDYDAIARDLSMDYSEAVVAGERLIFRCR